MCINVQTVLYLSHSSQGKEYQKSFGSDHFCVHGCIDWLNNLTTSHFKLNERVWQDKLLTCYQSETQGCDADPITGLSLCCGVFPQCQGLCKLVPGRVRSKVLSVLQRVSRWWSCWQQKLERPTWRGERLNNRDFNHRRRCFCRLQVPTSLSFMNKRVWQSGSGGKTQNKNL